MANDKQPRTTAAKRTTKAKTKVPTTPGSVTTAEPTVTTARNATIQGNATFDIDDVRKRAYELYEERGGSEGGHENDWYRAEQELRNRANGKNIPVKKKTA